MAKVIFMHFDMETDGVYEGKIGEPIVRLAKEKKIPIPFAVDGDYSNCLISVENLSNEEPTSYMEDEENLSKAGQKIVKTRHQQEEEDKV